MFKKVRLDENSNDKTKDFLAGKDSISIKNSFSSKDGKTFATIGEGNINVGEISHNGKAISLGGVNRDIENNKVITRDEVTGALDAEVTIDHRLFSEAGRKDKLDDILDLPQDIADIVLKVVEDGYSAVKGVIDGNNKERFEAEKFLQEIKKDPDKAIEFLNLYEKDPEKAREILQNLGDFIEDKDSTKKEREKEKEGRHDDIINLYNNNDEERGYNYSDTRDMKNKEEAVGINTKTVDLNNFGEVLSVMLHEKQNVGGHKDDEEADEAIMNHLIRYNNILDRYYDYDELKVKDKNAGKNWNEKYKDNSVLTSGNLARDRQYNTAESFKGTSDEEKVKFNEAKIGKRKLDGMEALSFIQGGIIDTMNKEILHEHIFFEDELGGNIGFMGNGIGLAKDKEKNLSKYKITEINLDDKIIREAIENIRDKYTADKYNLLFHNCQSFVKDVKKEYNKIKKRNI